MLMINGSVFRVGFHYMKNLYIVTKQCPVVTALWENLV